MNNIDAPITTAVISLVKDFVKSAISSGRNFAADQIGKAQIDLTAGFERYLSSSSERANSVKTLICKDEPVDFDEIYIRSYVRLAGNRTDEDELVEELVAGRLLIISGNAGCGKSMLMRSVFLRAIRKPFGFIPFLIELRNLRISAIDGRSSFDIIEGIYDYLRHPLSNLRKEQFIYGLEQGKFVLLFDGIDEVPPQYRYEISMQIIDISRRYRRVPILCSSRPSDRFIGWTEFTQCEIIPFDKQQVVDFVERIPFESKIKKLFLKSLNLYLFERYREFLSNPLLCTMMLLTYHEHREIPERMHTFYSMAFDVLYSRHDRSKPAEYKRKFYADVASDKFKNVFTTFCAITYYKDLISMTKSDLSSIVASALTRNDQSCDPSNFVSDLTESTSLIIEDGERLTFIHRSFQEYFVARYIIENFGDTVPLLIDKSVGRGDQVIALLCDMNREALEVKFLVSELGECIKTFESIKPRVNPAALFSLLYSAIEISTFDRIFANANPVVDNKGRFSREYTIIRICEINYGLTPIWPDLTEDWGQLVEKYRGRANSPWQDKFYFENPDNSILLDTKIPEAFESLIDNLINISTRIRRRNSEKFGLF